MTIIANALQCMFPEDGYKHHNLLKLNYLGFIWRILMPEALCSIVREDHPDATEDEIAQIVEVSKDYGACFHPEDDSEDGMIFARRLAERRGGLLESNDVVVKNEPAESSLGEAMDVPGYTIETREDGKEILVFDL